MTTPGTRYFNNSKTTMAMNLRSPLEKMDQQSLKICRIGLPNYLHSQLASTAMNFSVSTKNQCRQNQQALALNMFPFFMSCCKAQESPCPWSHCQRNTKGYLIRPWIFGRTLWDKFSTLKLLYGNIFQIVALGITCLPHAFSIFERHPIVNPTLVDPFAPDCIVIPWLSTFTFAFAGRSWCRLFIIFRWNCSRIPSSLHGRGVLGL